jgi:hypothetical protein
MCLVQQTAAEPNPRVPVLVELFTSEGCSTCPPADNLLIGLSADQPVPDAQIVALGFHVDYWNHDGWTDRFSSSKFTDRQKDYDFYLKTEPYTPQMVVDGVEAMIGSDTTAVERAIDRSARTPKGVQVKLTREQQQITVSIQGDPGRNAEAFLALVEDGVQTAVKDGENKGRTLHHAAVVRDFRSLGHPANGSWTATAPLKVAAGENLAAMHAVVFLQDRRSRKVLGVSEVALQ